MRCRPTRRGGTSAPASAARRRAGARSRGADPRRSRRRRARAAASAPGGSAGVHAECDELDPRAVAAEPASKLVDLAPAVRNDRVEPAKRVARRAASRAPPRSCASRSGSPIAAYTTGGFTRPRRPRSASGIPTVSTVENTTSARLSVPRRGEHAGEVARVPAAEPHRAIENAGLGAGASAGLEPGSRSWSTAKPAAPEPVEPVQAVPRRIADRRTERSPTQRRVADRGRRRSAHLERGRLDHVG